MTLNDFHINKDNVLKDFEYRKYLSQTYFAFTSHYEYLE